MAKICTYKSAGACGFLEDNLSPCANCPYGKKAQPGDLGAKGDKGDRGDRGEKGDLGPPGIKGDEGQRGSMGLIGLPGTQGFDGRPGLPGVKGDKGDKGEQGEKGEKGEDGKEVGQNQLLLGWGPRSPREHADDKHSDSDSHVKSGDAAGGELEGTYPDPTVATTHAGSPHHEEYTDDDAITAVPFIQYIPFGSEPITGQSYAP